MQAATAITALIHVSISIVMRLDKRGQLLHPAFHAFVQVTRLAQIQRDMWACDTVEYLVNVGSHDDHHHVVRLYKLHVCSNLRPNLISLTPLLNCADMPTEVKLLLVHRSNFGQVPVLPPPTTHTDISGSWTQVRWAQVRHLNYWFTTAPCFLSYRMNNSPADGPLLAQQMQL